MTNNHAAVSQQDPIQAKKQSGGTGPSVDSEEALECIMDGLAATILDAPEEEILAEFRKQGRDPIAEADEVRKILLDAVKKASSDSKHDS